MKNEGKTSHQAKSISSVKPPKIVEPSNHISRHSSEKQIHKTRSVPLDQTTVSAIENGSNLRHLIIKSNGLAESLEERLFCQSLPTQKSF